MNLEVFDKERFINNFKYKMNNLFKKMPLDATIKLTEPELSIQLANKEEPIHYILDYNIPVKKNVYRIKQLLFPFFPVLKYRKIQKRKATAEESERLINDGMSIEDALNYTFEDENIETYVIHRQIVDRNEVFIIRQEDGKEFQYRLKNSFPVSIFLVNIRTKIYKDAFEAGEDFFKNSEFLQNIFKEDEYEAMKKLKRNSRLQTVSIFEEE